MTKRVLFFAFLLALLPIWGATGAVAQLSQMQRAELQSVNLLGPWNPGFEAGTAYWTNTGGTLSATTTSSNVGQGVASASWSGTSGNMLASRAVTVPAGLLGQQCLGSMLVKAGDANAVLEAYDVTTSSSLGSSTLSVASGYVFNFVVFTCPAAQDSIQLRVRATATTATYFLDKAFLGLPASPVITSSANTELVNSGQLVATDGSIYPKSGSKNYLSGGAYSIGGIGGAVWKASSSAITVANDTTAADEPEKSVGSSFKITGVSGSSAFVYASFELDQADYGRKLKVQFMQNALSGFVTNDFRLDVYSCTVAWSGGTCGGTSARLPLWPTDVSATSGGCTAGTTCLPAATGRYWTTFDAPGVSGAHFIQVQIGLNTTATHSMTFSSFEVSNGQIAPTASVSGWRSVPQYTMFTNASITSPTYNSLVVRQVGDSVEFRGVWGDGTAVNTSSNGVTFNLPSGYTINTSELANTSIRDAFTSAYWNAGGSSVTVLQPYYGTSTTVFFRKQGGGQLIESNLSTNAEFTFDFTLPINELAGTGTVSVAAPNDNIYVSNSDNSNTATNTSSFAYGPSGSLIPNGATGTNYARQVHSPYPIQNGMMPVIEVLEPGTSIWLNASDRLAANITCSTQAYGIQINAVAGSSTDFTVTFLAGGFRASNGCTGTAGQAWSTINTYMWRARLPPPSAAAVGTAVVQPGTAAGLVSASGLPTNQTGNAPGLGYVGHSQTLNGVTTGSTSEANLTSIQVPPCTAVLSATVTTGTAAAIGTYLEANINANPGVSTGVTLGVNRVYAAMNASQGSGEAFISSYIVQPGATTTYYLNARTDHTTANDLYWGFSYYCIN